MKESGLVSGEMQTAWESSELADQGWSETQTANFEDIPYELSNDNKYVNDENPYEVGLKLFHAGNVHEAILAFEAAVTQDDTHSDAWHMLGISHQENDQDPKAIACLERAVENDVYHLGSLLGLGVSYVNELNQQKALKNLKAWIIHNPKFAGLSIEADVYGDGSLMDEMMQLMIKAAEFSPNDPEVHQVMGVLYNVSRDYNSAAISFKKAINNKPNDYSMWNRLGATLANGQRSAEAIPAYERALELKPSYARGWLNLGISHSNLGSYIEAANAYLKALDLNPGAVHIWSYLRITFTCMERFDLISLVDDRNMNALRTEFRF